MKIELIKPINKQFVAYESHSQAFWLTVDS